MTPTDMQEKAMQIFSEGLHCSQAVIAVAQEKLGMENVDLIKAMDAFGGGLCGHGEICGAFIGGQAAIGLLYGRSKPGTQADMKMLKSCRIFMKRFRTEVTDNKILCRDLVNVDWMDIDQVKQYRGGDKQAFCQELTGKTAKLVGEILEMA